MKTSFKYHSSMPTPSMNHVIKTSRSSFSIRRVLNVYNHGYSPTTASDHFASVL